MGKTISSKSTRRGTEKNVQKESTQKTARKALGFATLAIHAGQNPDQSTGAITLPIYQTTTYVQEAINVHKGFTYSRTENPTVAALEENLRLLEHGEGAACFSTGMSSISALFSLLSKGDHVVMGNAVYAGTMRLANEVLSRFGVKFVYVDSRDVDAVAKAVSEKTKILLIETPSNPTLRLANIKEISKVKKSAKLVVDNTLLTPALQVPLDLGADLVLHSTTKYIEGHNTSLGGATVAKKKKDIADLKYLQNAMGLIQTPFNAWLTLRGLKTLDLRMKKHSENAKEIAEHLEDHSKVTKVYYPSLAGFPQSSIAREQHRNGHHGGLLSFELIGGKKTGMRFARSLRLISVATSLGATETMVAHPATMTHAEMSRKARLEAGFADSLIRVSVGLEDASDLVSDLDQAISRATS